MNDACGTEARTGLYDRLLRRVTLALDEADTAERLRDEHPAELELKGLSLAELGLIRAYLNHDLSQLRGCHAATDRARPRTASPRATGRSWTGARS